ncbi:MAG: serine/threonine-protein kinase [Gammaproteobacteria bacterium]
MIPPDVPDASADDAPPPERLGPYRLGELLGKGGMGRVYRAERADGLFEQTIAIKLMRRSRMPSELADQFARERQILARLQHRNIAHLFDGGVSPEGLSYFVMELVEGRPISQYASEERLAIRPALRLFSQVCSAVQYAHAHLVVHADIKPNNIIVTADGTAKLLDFGVARVIADAGESVAAPSGSLGITHYYASPARRRGDLPSTIDDVYSLGVLLRELLKLYQAISPELRSICERACAEDPSARYVSVDALKEDIQRLLDGFAVRAHGEAWPYVARKFLARHRIAVGAAVAGVLLLVGAASALAVLYMRTEVAKTRAERRFNDVRELSRYVLFDVYDRLESVPRGLTLRRDIAAKGQQYLNDLAQDPMAPVDVRMEVIEGLRRLAAVQGDAGSASLAQVPVARANLVRAEAMARALPEDSRYARERALVLTKIFIARARIAMAMELDLPAALRALNEAEKTLAPLTRPDSKDAEAQGLALDLAVERAAHLQWEGKYDESIKVAREALQAERPESGATPPERRAAVRRHARLLDIFAESTYYSGDRKGAEAPYRQQYALLRGLASEEPQNLRAARAFMRAGWALGSTLLDLGKGRLQEAERYLSESYAAAGRLRLLEPEDKDLIRMESISAASEAQALALLGRVDQGLPILERAVGARRLLWKESPKDWAVARDYAVSLKELGDTRLLAREPVSACANYRESVEVFERMRAAGRLPKLDEDYTLKPLDENMARSCQEPVASTLR